MTNKPDKHSSDVVRAMIKMIKANLHKMNKTDLGVFAGNPTIRKVYNLGNEDVSNYNCMEGSREHVKIILDRIDEDFHL